MPSYTASLSSEATEDFVAIADETATGHVVDLNTVTVEESGNHLVPMQKPSSYRKPVYVELTLADSVGDAGSGAGSRLYIGNLDKANSYPSGWLDGGTARIMRVTNGDLVDGSEANIVNCVCRSTQNIFRDTRVPAGTSSVNWSPATYYRGGAGGTYYFAVASVDANGDRSAWSTLQTGTLSAVHSQVSDNPTQISAQGLEDQNLSGNVNGSLATPTGFTVTSADSGSSWDFSWTEPVDGNIVGYVVYWSQYSEFDNQSYLDLDAAIGQAEDGVVIRKVFDAGLTTEDVASFRVWGLISEYSKLAMFNGVMLNEDINTTGISLSLGESGFDTWVTVTNNTGGAYSLQRVTHGGTNVTREFYDVLEPGKTYASQIVARSTTPNALTFSAGGNATTLNGVVTLGTDWTTVESTFSCSEVFTGNAADSSYVLANGASVDIRSWNVYEKDTPIWEWVPRDQALLDDFGGGYLRHHGTCKTAPWSYDLERLTDRWGAATCITLPIVFRQCVAGGLKPWLQIETHFSEAEILGLVEFLCAPYVPGTDTPAGKPWAYKRWSLAQEYPELPATPWKDEIAGPWIIEPGNENWNTLSGFYTWPAINGLGKGTLNGLCTDRWYRVMSSSPYFDAADWLFFAGGKANDNGQNSNVISSTRHADLFGVAAYNSGKDVGDQSPPDGTPDSWQTVVGFVGHSGREAQMQANLIDLCANASTLNPARTKPLLPVTYEAGPGYVEGGMTSEEYWLQSAVMKSRGSAAATIDTTVLLAALGVRHQNYFTFGNSEGSSVWKSHVTGIRGGAACAPFLWFTWLNQNCEGATFRKVQVARAPTKTMAGQANCVSVAAYRADVSGKTFIFVVNRDTAASHTVRILCPTGGSLTRHYLTGTDYTAHNTTVATKDDVAFATEALTPAFPLVRTIPAGDAEVYEIA